GLLPCVLVLASCCLQPRLRSRSARLVPGLRGRRAFGQVLAIEVRPSIVGGPHPTPPDRPMALTVVVRSGDHPTPLKISLDAPRLATREIALALVSSALAAQGEAAAVKVIVTAGPDSGQELTIAEPGRAYVIGRGQGLDLTLSDADASRRHVEVSRRGPHLW